MLSNRLRLAILNGDITPGAKLRLDDLRSRFGVSLSPVREALSRLAAEGFVLSHKNRGFSVAEVSRENLAEITLLRSQLEGLAVDAAIARGGNEWEERLVGVCHRLTKIEQQNVDGRRIEDWERAHRQFHFGLISACGTPLLLNFCAVLHDQNDRYRRLFLKRHPSDRDVVREHRAILDAVLKRDAARAKRLLQQHIERTGRNVLAAMPVRSSE